jgi:hypothetical protein
MKNSHFCPFFLFIRSYYFNNGSLNMYAKGWPKSRKKYGRKLLTLPFEMISLIICFYWESVLRSR